MAMNKRKSGEYYVYPDGSVTSSPLDLEGYPILITYAYVGNSKDELRVDFSPDIQPAQLELIIASGHIDKQARTVMEQILSSGNISSGIYEIPSPDKSNPGI